MSRSRRWVRRIHGRRRSGREQPEGGGRMKYMLLMQRPQSGHEEMRTMAHEELRRSGEHVDGQGLTGPEQAIIVQAQDDGPPVVSDGPFPEAKEFLAGY